MMKIALSQEQFALVDNRDFAYLSQWKWYAHYDKVVGGYYAVRNIRIGNKRSRESMHRVIMNSKKGDIVDHKNHCTTDNRRENLINTNQLQNQKNRLIRKNNKYGFTGITFIKKTSRWQARITIDYKTISLGVFATLQDAIEARNKGNIKYGFHENHGKTINQIAGA